MIRFLAFALLVVTMPCVDAAVSIPDPGQGIYDFTGSGPGLSGLTYLGGSDFYAASDSRSTHRTSTR